MDLISRVTQTYSRFPIPPSSISFPLPNPYSCFPSFPFRFSFLFIFLSLRQNHLAIVIQFLVNTQSCYTHKIICENSVISTVSRLSLFVRSSMFLSRYVTRFMTYIISILRFYNNINSCLQSGYRLTFMMITSIFITFNWHFMIINSRGT